MSAPVEDVIGEKGLGVCGYGEVGALVRGTLPAGRGVGDSRRLGVVVPRARVRGLLKAWGHLA
jgi:hypothetical protein